MSKTENMLTMHKIEDVYPSRGGQQAQITQRHDPVVYNQDLSASPIDANLVKSYEENGFVVLPDLFNEEEVECFRKELACLLDNARLQKADETITEPGSGEIRSIFCVHRLSSIFRKLANDQRLAGLASYLLDNRVYIHQSRVNYKPGFRGKEFYWHSDFETWHVEDGMPLMRAVSMSIALTENHTYNGPLMLIPGSHKNYVVCGGDTPEDNYKASLKKQVVGVPDDEMLNQLVENAGIVSATGKPGSVTVFDCNTMHGSNGNITPLPRSNVFLVYNAVTNRVVDPFCDQSPRPEYICSRKYIDVLAPTVFGAADYAAG